MDGHDAVVYDLDGTLVDLAVDWDRVATDATVIYQQAGFEPPAESLWTMLEAADQYGLAAEIEAVIAQHERNGARESIRLPLADDLLSRLERKVPIGICSLNSETAVRIALEQHGLAAHLDRTAVIGRDSVSTQKPDPEPLLATIRNLNVSPADTLFIGDSPRDEETAKRAGTDFAYVDDFLQTIELND